jgi:hypothetical protein
MCILIVRQRLGKHIPTEANAGNGRTSIAIQRISKYASLTIEAVFSAWSVQSGYEQVFSSRVSTEVWRVVENWAEFWKWQSKVIENKCQEMN